MSDCQKYRELMNAVMDREATEEELLAWENHVKGCEACSRLFNDLTRIKEDIGKMSAQPPFDLKTRILQRAAEEKQEDNIRHLHRRKALRNSLVGTVAAAAVIAAVLMGAFPLVKQYFDAGNASDAVMTESMEFTENVLEDLADDEFAGVDGEAENEAFEGFADNEDSDDTAKYSAIGETNGNAGSVSLSRDEILTKVREAFGNMSISGFAGQIIYMSSDRFPDGEKGEAVAGMPDVRLYTVDTEEDYVAFSEKAAAEITCELTEDEISEIGLQCGGRKILILMALND